MKMQSVFEMGDFVCTLEDLMCQESHLLQFNGLIHHFKNAPSL